MPEGLADRYIFEFLTSINLDISLAINAWTHKERRAIMMEVQREQNSPNKKDKKAKYINIENGYGTPQDKKMDDHTRSLLLERKER